MRKDERNIFYSEFTFTQEYLNLAGRAFVIGDRRLALQILKSWAERIIQEISTKEKELK